MEDLKIIQLYWSRDESAIVETKNKYGNLLHSIALNILSNRQDSEECINDTYNRAWNTMPPEKPKYLPAYLGRIVRNISINLWHKNRAQKRYDGMDLFLSELEEVIPDFYSIDKEMENKDLANTIKAWLYTLSQDDRLLFVRRYWFGDSLKKLADESGTNPNKLAGHMYRLRLSLKNALEKEEVFL